MTSLTYRYWCTSENAWVTETRLASASAPTQCVNDASVFSPGSLAIVDHPDEFGDIEFCAGAYADFSQATLYGVSHTSLNDIGTHTHGEIDTHIDDASLHRTIDDGATGATDLWSASKISSELAAKSATGHTHTASDVTDFDSAVDSRITDQKGGANGLATLDVNSKIPTSQLPAIAITNVSVVADITARDELSPDAGDVVKVTDSGSGLPQTYIYDGSTWIDIQETSDVVSVNGKTGVVSLSTTDVSEGTNLYYTDARFDTRLGTKDTDDLDEGSTNLYYTDARVDARIAATATDNVLEGVTNLYYTDARVDARIAAADTDDLSEGSTNLYYTSARFDTRLATKDTDDITEGSTNLYYTEARVNANTEVAANSTHRARTDNPHNVTKAQVGLSNVDNLKNNLSAVVDPASTNDTSEGYAVGSRWVNTTTSHSFVCVDATNDSAVWKATTTRVPEQVAIGYQTNSSVYVTPLAGGTYLYYGSAIAGIASIKVIAAHSTDTDGYEFDVRVIDYDNSGAVVAEATGLSGNTKTVHDLGTIANVPSSDHVFEVQIRRSGTVGDKMPVTLYTLAFHFL